MLDVTWLSEYCIHRVGYSSLDLRGTSSTSTRAFENGLAVKPFMRKCMARGLEDAWRACPLESCFQVKSLPKSCSQTSCHAFPNHSPPKKIKTTRQLPSILSSHACLLCANTFFARRVHVCTPSRAASEVRRQINRQPAFLSDTFPSLAT